MSKNFLALNKEAKICLNMIVKNESKIITRLFDSVINLIDSYCICDTGSTDNTVDIIKNYFSEKKIPGKIVTEPFKNFGYNRSFAMKMCEGKPNADYLLLLDADMILQIQDDMIPIIKQQLWKNELYYVFQGSETFHYKNVRFAKNNMGFSYWGVTHEYVKVPDNMNCIYGLFEKKDIFINDVGDGGSKQDKFLRDIELLQRGLEEIPNNDRYTFYLANSYRDSGQHEMAIETYKKRIKLGGWLEEVWHSYLSLGRCYKKLNNMKEAIYYWLEGYNFFPKRIENLYEIIEFYRNNGQNNIAYEFYSIANRVKKEHFKDDFLFLEKAIYDYKLDYEMSIIGYYCNPDNLDLSKLSMNLLNNSTIESWMFKNILSNYKFYTDKITQLSNHSTLIYSYQNIHNNLELTKKLFCKDSSFVSSTPSIILHDNNIIFNIRYVNYYVNEKGEYIQKNNIKTINKMFSMSLPNWYEYFYIKNDEQNNFFYKNGNVIQYNESLDNSVYIGLEDVRLFLHNDKILYSANRGLSHNNIVVECGEIQQMNKIMDSSVLINPQHQNNIEKNWVLFEDEAGKLKCIYKWHPLTIADLVFENQEFKCENFCEYPSPVFFNQLRGSTNGIIIDNEIWFICHLVSYEDRRYYYHILVTLDKETYKINNFSRLFTFEKEKVEYCLGFIYDKEKNMFSIGYSTMDNTTKFILISKEKMESLL